MTRAARLEAHRVEYSFGTAESAIPINPSDLDPSHFRCDSAFSPMGRQPFPIAEQIREQQQFSLNIALGVRQQQLSTLPLEIEEEQNSPSPLPCIIVSLAEGLILADMLKVTLLTFQTCKIRAGSVHYYAISLSTSPHSREVIW